MSHKLIQISSKDRAPSVNLIQTNADFQISFNNATALQGIKKITLKQATFTNVFFNVNEYNSTFVYSIGGVRQESTIQVGQRTLQEFITAFEAANTAIGMSVTVIPFKNRLQFTTTTAINYYSARSAVFPNPMGDILGIHEDQNSPDFTTYVARGVVNLSGEQNVYIQSQKLGESNLITSSTNDNQRNILGIVPITVPYGFTNHYVSQHSDLDSNNPHHTEILGRNIQTIDIKLLDSQGRRLSIYNHHVEIILKAYY